MRDHKDFDRGILCEQMNNNWLIVYCFWDNWKEVDEFMENDIRRFDHSDLIDGQAEILRPKLGMDFRMIRHYHRRGIEEQDQKEKEKRDQIRQGHNRFIYIPFPHETPSLPPQAT